MYPSHDFGNGAAWIYSVFGGRGAVGNSTGVVRVADAVDPERAQAIAARLGLSDTAFVWPLAPERYAIRFFSPNEELLVCYQALLAAAAALQGSRTDFVSKDRVLRVEASQGHYWVVTPAELVVSEETFVRTPFGVGRVIDTGRRRAYVDADSQLFATATLAPEAAFEWLEQQGLAGLCLVHAATGGRVCLRVFTTSLLGREDVATGGAALALPLLLEQTGRFEVQQGIGGAPRRGVIVVDASHTSVRIGGVCECLFAGQLQVK